MNDAVWKALQKDLNYSALPRQKISLADLQAAILDWYCPLVAANLPLPLFFVLDTGFGFWREGATQLDPSRSTEPYRAALQKWLERLRADSYLRALSELNHIPSCANPTDWQARRPLTQACACTFPIQKSPKLGWPLQIDPEELDLDRLKKAWNFKEKIAPEDRNLQTVIAAIQKIIPEKPTSKPGMPEKPAALSEARLPALAWIGEVVQAYNPAAVQPAAPQETRRPAIDLPALTGFRSGVSEAVFDELRIQQQRMKAHQYSEAQEGRPPTDGFDGITVGRDIQHVLASELAKGPDIFTIRYLENKLNSLKCMRRDYKPFRLLLALSIDVSPEMAKTGRRAQSICREWGSLFLQDAILCLNTLLSGSQHELRLQLMLDACILTRFYSNRHMLVSQSEVISKMSGGDRTIDSLQSLRRLEEMARQGWTLPVTALGHPHDRPVVPMAKFMRFDAGEVGPKAGTPAVQRTAAYIIRRMFRVSSHTTLPDTGAVQEAHPYHLAILISAVHSGHEDSLDGIRLSQQESSHVLALSKDGITLRYHSKGRGGSFSPDLPDQHQTKARHMFLRQMVLDLERAIQG